MGDRCAHDHHGQLLWQVEIVGVLCLASQQWRVFYSWHWAIRIGVTYAKTNRTALLPVVEQRCCYRVERQQLKSIFTIERSSGDRVTMHDSRQ